MGQSKWPLILQRNEHGCDRLTTAISTKGQVVLPKAIRDQL